MNHPLKLDDKDLPWVDEVQHLGHTLHKSLSIKSWNKQARLCWNVDRRTHKNIVEDFLCQDQQSLRTQIYCRYPEFIRKQFSAPSKEIRFLINIVKDDARSRTCQNIRFLSDLVNDDCLALSTWKMEDALPKNLIPPNESYKKSLLSLLLEIRMTRNYEDLTLTKTQLEEIILSLCTS